MKNILIIGSTGSIGTQTLDIVRAFPGEYRVSGLAAGSNSALLARQIAEFKPDCVSLEFASMDFTGVKSVANSEELVDSVDWDIAVLAAVGAGGLKAAFKAAATGRRIALANKEVLVAAGELFMALAAKSGAEIIPVDSEHSAIWQCLKAALGRPVKKILLTASGGAFRGKTKRELKDVTVKDALKHPVWNMGAKVTIDSATLMNKGLEVIEAVRLFGVSSEQIEVLVHPESIVHSMVEFSDNCVIAELSAPDMRLPIQNALAYPKETHSLTSEVDFLKLGKLTFTKPDTDAFPCLNIAYRCLKAGGAAPAVMNAANEMAVKYFAEGWIGFYGIPEMIEMALDRFSGSDAGTVEGIISIDAAVKEYILTSYGKRGA